MTYRAEDIEALSPIQNADLCIELEAAFAREQAHQESLRLFRAMMLSPTVEACEALLRGEDVPAERLDPRWVRRYRRGTT